MECGAPMVEYINIYASDDGCCDIIKTTGAHTHRYYSPSLDPSLGKKA